jgi:hypothetical protein
MTRRPANRRAVTVTVVVLLAATACTATSTPSTTTLPTAPPDTTTTTTVAETSTTSSSTSTLPQTTTTTKPPLVIAQSINGLPVDDVASILRRVIAIKIDNHGSARPQTGVQEADAVFEILVEGGYTRFITLFHQTDLDYVGPVRSGRPTDINVVKPLDAPFQISGAQKFVIDMFKSEGLHMVYDNGVTTWRVRHRKAPHNLYTSSVLLRDWADARGWVDDNPGNLFKFGRSPTTDQRAHQITFDWSNQPPVIWKWTGSTYLRFNDTEPHGWISEDGTREGTVSAETLLAIVGTRYTVSPPTTTTTTSTTIEGEEPLPPPKAETPVPAIDVVGTGEAVLFINGQVFEGTWSKDAKDAPFKLFHDDGSVMEIPPSRIWVSIFPSNRDITWN